MTRDVGVCSIETVRPGHLHLPRPVPKPRRPTHPAPDQVPALLDLQMSVGNRAVTGMMIRPVTEVRPVQRVKVDGSFDENILQPYDEANKKTKTLQPHKYSQDIHYDLTRAATQVDVVVKIRFVAPDGTAIPAADNSRRDYINRMTAGIATAWAGKYEFVSTQHPAPPATAPPATGSAPTTTPAPAPAVTPAPAPGTAAPPAAVPVRLPVVFKAVPEYAPADDGTMPVVNIHPMSEAADSNTPGKRIDSGNWFQNEGNYATGLSAADAEKESVKTAAHEYGHLLGIPDEYSQSNANMHKLMHQASPTLSAGQDNLLDDSARKWMVLRAMYPALARHAKAGAVKATAAIGKQKPNLERELRAAVAGIWTDPAAVAAVNTKIVAQLTAGGHPGPGRQGDARLCSTRGPAWTPGGSPPARSSRRSVWPASGP